MIKIYSTNWCPSCIWAKKLLDNINIQYEEINIEEINMSRKDLQSLTGGSTVPQIVINGKSIGGYDDLLKLNNNGKLEKLIKL
ncbi:MAG: glutaredoxin [Candidatus Marinimicrobia bacterium]|nr:glutaredoxin [Candidatus Neomarinimicrobiota bacterium]|tara:strand:- start:6443 stop:6691 length:249 start_codon:yes stop_codon:yes gene_type:complete